MTSVTFNFRVCFFMNLLFSTITIDIVSYYIEHLRIPPDAIYVLGEPGWSIVFPVNFI